ncbi:uncharacterized protein A4U43_C05F10030 [Asparagus officinalis]|uniref:Ion transport domain-containing protein n=1 Tax=Asparagus officinalis TaxID=4686 RepID=A0A5P1EUY5_ASPOF|nr:protein CNGC15b-like [Asparagus officinalis]ONK68311.1 uncharacterized protein A4U43_C05F10030 [Asparagus officinalis]
MAFPNSRSVRFRDEVGLGNSTTNENYDHLKYKCPSESGSASGKPHRSFKAKVLSRVFSEDYESVRAERKKRIFDPRGPAIHQWNRIFLVACIFSLFLDPLFFYLPGTREEDCVEISVPLVLALTILRSLADVFYVVQIFFRFRTAFVAPSSRVFGRGELVIEPSKIAHRYLSRGFWLDLLAALPISQVVIWLVIPNLEGSTTRNTKNFLRFCIIFQYIPRLFLIFPLSSQIVKTSGVMMETAWAGAAYNLVLYMLVSHVSNY